MNNETFIIDLINEYNNNKYDKIEDLLDITLEEYVLNNTIDINKKIINIYVGDIYDAINIYNVYLGNINNKSKEYFYQQLAYISLFINLYPIIINYSSSK
jgi:hypothetical protein